MDLTITDLVKRIDSLQKKIEIYDTLIGKVEEPMHYNPMDRIVPMGISDIQKGIIEKYDSIILNLKDEMRRIQTALDKLNWKTEL